MAELKDVNAELIAGLPDLGPVVMVNLLRLRDRDAYRRYSELAMPLIKSRGGTVIWAGNGEAVAFGDPVTDSWDYVVLVRYPSRAAFVDMVGSPSTPLPTCTASRPWNATSSWQVPRPTRKQRRAARCQPLPRRRPELQPTGTMVLADRFQAMSSANCMSSRDPGQKRCARSGAR